MSEPSPGARERNPTHDVSPGRWSPARNLVRSLVTVPIFLAEHFLQRCRIAESTHTVEAFSESAPDHVESDPDDVLAVQTEHDGVGPLLMRTYEVRIGNSRLTPAELMERLIARPADLNDDRIAAFVRDDRPAVDLVEGDEVVVELPGPWNGPVRVVRADADELRLQTLDGHMEAGQIRFTAERPPDASNDGDVVFRIRSWARGGDQTFNLLHLGLRVAKEMQTAMWVAMCDGAVRVCEGERMARISVRTEVLADSTPADDRVGAALEKVGGER